MVFSVILLIILILFNGIFSSSEMAFLSINKIKLKEDVYKKDKKAIIIDRILKDKSTFLSTIQVGITLAGFLASAFAADYFADYIYENIEYYVISEGFTHNLLVVLITILLSYFTLVFGELVPKKIAINNPYRIARMFVRLIVVVRIIFYPLIKVLTITTNFICKILRIKDNKDNLSEEDIKKIILLGNEEGVIEEKEKEYILSDVVVLNIDNDLKDNIKIIKETKFSRFPVYKDNIDNIIGLINVKDLILSKRDNESIDINSLIRPIHKFKHSKKIDDVFRYMQEMNESMCAVFKNNKFIGVVTIEDAVEEIVGNIYDEYDL